MAIIDERLKTPLYHQIYLILRNKILSGEAEYDTFFPGEKDTSNHFGVSRITAKRALNELARSGLVKRERGRGTRVIYKLPKPSVHGGIDGLMDNLQSMARASEVKLNAFDYVPADNEVADALQIKPGTQIQRAVRVRSLEGEAFSHLTTFVPERIGRTYERSDLANTALLTLIENSGVSISRAEQTINAGLSDVEVSTALGLDIGSPLLGINRVVFDQNDTPVEFIKALYRPDRYKYTMKLSRIGEERARAWAAVEG